MGFSLVGLANIAQIISVPLTLLAWLITRERFAEFWQKRGKPILAIAVILTVVALWHIGWLNWLQYQVAWPVWGLLLYPFTLLLVLKWLRDQKRRIMQARLYYNHQQKVETLTELIDKFTTFEKARCLADTIKGNVRVVAILRVEEGRIGVMLNIGRKENLQVGTQLLVRRIDRYTFDGQRIEQPLGLVRITYVQAENNLSQAVVLRRLDPEFWDQATARLRQEEMIDPPKNFAVPYIPQELRGLSLEDLMTFRHHLEATRDSPTRTEPDQFIQEEVLQ